LRNQGSEAVSIAVEEAKVYVQSQKIVGADETGFKQGNADGKNADKKRLVYNLTNLVNPPGNQGEICFKS